MSRVWPIVVVAVSLVSSTLTLNAQEIQRIPTYRTVVKVLREQEVTVQVAGRLKNVLPKEEGLFVTKGDLLVELNDEKIQAEVMRVDREATRMTEINFAKVSLEASEEDQAAKREANQESPGAYSPSEMRQIKLEVDKAVASLEKAREDQEIARLEAAVKHAELAEYKVYAPNDGVITDIKMFAGQSVRPGDPVVTLTDLSVLKAEVYVPFQYRDSLHIGDEVEIRPRGGNVAAAPQNAVIQRASAQEPAFDESPFSKEEDEPIFKSSPKQDAPAVVPAIGSASGEIFVGKIKYIQPRLIVENLQTYVVLSVHIPNPRDNEGRYRLQEGMPVDAVILSTTNR